MLYGYLSRVYTDLVSLPMSVEMTGERSLHFPATILWHHITVLTVQVTEQHLGCDQATMEEPAVTCEGIPLTSMFKYKSAPGNISRFDCSSCFLFLYCGDHSSEKEANTLGQKLNLRQKTSEDILRYWMLAAGY